MSKQTTNHDEIRRWAEARNGRPATVTGTAKGDEHVGILHIAFTEDDALDSVTWDEFFDKFEAEKLAFLYQDTIDDAQSRFFKFVSRQ